MTAFDILKETLPKIDFVSQQNAEKAIQRIIKSNLKFFKLDKKFDDVKIISLNEENVEVKVIEYWSGLETFISIPIKIIIDEKKFVESVEKWKEKELKLKEEKKRKELEEKEKAKKEAEEREYKNYLRLKKKYEHKG